jgi:hypothetical protein
MLSYAQSNFLMSNQIFSYTLVHLDELAEVDEAVPGRPRERKPKEQR